MTESILMFTLKNELYTAEKGGQLTVIVELSIGS